LWEPGETAKDSVKAQGRIDSACAVILLPKTKIKILLLDTQEGKREDSPKYGLFVVADEK